MSIDDIRKTLVDEALREYKQARLSYIPKALGGVIALGILVYLCLRSPTEWAKGDFFQPGGWMYETLGFDNAVLSVRVFVGALFGLFSLWFLKILYSVTFGLPAERAKIEAAQTRFRPE